MYVIALKSLMVEWTKKSPSDRAAAARGLANQIIETGIADDIRACASSDVVDSFDRFLFALLEWK